MSEQPVLSGAITLGSNDFELFGLEPRMAQNRAALDLRWKALQREAHPDKFAAQGAAAQRVAMQWSVRINEAYQRLKDPLRRAAYLCELNGVPVNAENNTAMPADFLMKQIEWREMLDEAVTVQDVDKIAQLLKQEKLNMLQKCEHSLDTEPDFRQAVGHVRSLMFVERLTHDVNQRLEQLESNSA